MLLNVYSSLSNSQLKTIKKGFKLGFCLPNNSKQAMFYMATLQEGRKRLKNPKIMFCVVPHTSFTLSGNPIVWNFVREEWSYLVDRFSLNDRTLGRLPKTLTSDFSSEFQLQETKDFFSRYPDAGAGKLGIAIMYGGGGWVIWEVANPLPRGKKCPPRHLQVAFELLSQLHLLNCMKNSATLDLNINYSNRRG